MSSSIVAVEPKIGRPTAKPGTIRVLPEGGMVRLSEDLSQVPSYRVLVSVDDRQLIFRVKGPYKVFGKGRSKYVRIGSAFTAMKISDLREVAGEYSIKKERNGFSVCLR